MSTGGGGEPLDTLLRLGAGDSERDGEVEYFLPLLGGGDLDLDLDTEFVGLRARLPLPLPFSFDVAGGDLDAPEGLRPRRFGSGDLERERDRLDEYERLLLTLRGAGDRDLERERDRDAELYEALLPPRPPRLRTGEGLRV